MKEFIEYVVKALVDNPNEVSVTQIDGEKTVIFELRCNESDIGKVIGKQGRTIKAIRTLLGSAAAKADVRAMLEIVE
ncbi:MAG: KH domain-containing protein [Candidatus Aureabacteria bacterium]|nr:KH domain-containing protein [Candidatus Auribacterota bacterium]